MDELSSALCCEPIGVPIEPFDPIKCGVVLHGFEAEAFQVSGGHMKTHFIDCGFISDAEIL